MPIRWTGQQVAIKDAVVGGESCKVIAYAGTGKTATALYVATEHHLKSIYLAFNKAIADEAKMRFGVQAPHVQVYTPHAYAYRIVGRRYADRLQKNAWQLRAALRDQHLPRFLRIARSPAEAEKLIFATMDVLRVFEQSGDLQIEQKHVPEEFFDAKAIVGHAEEILSIARESWEDMASLNGRLPISHDTYLKIFQLSGERLPFDVIYLDDGQDSNGVTLAIVQGQTETQRVIFGDPHQAIYGWRGAVNAMESVDLPEYPLTTSWRFGPEIASVANLVLKAKGARWPLEGGGPPGKVLLRGEKDPTAVLSRSNAGMVDVAIEQLEAGRKVGIIGGAERVASTIQGAYDLWHIGKSDHPSFRLFSTWAELEEAAQTVHGGNYRPIVRLVERFRYGIPDLAKRLVKETVAVEQAEVVLSTVHSDKGKEHDVVQANSDFPPFALEDTDPGTPVRTPGLDIEEANTAYVMLTRAIHELQIGRYYDVFKRSLEIMAEVLKGADLATKPAESDAVSIAAAP